MTCSRPSACHVRLPATYRLSESREKERNKKRLYRFLKGFHKLLAGEPSMFSVWRFKRMFFKEWLFVFLGAVKGDRSHMFLWGVHMLMFHAWLDLLAQSQTTAEAHFRAKLIWFLGTELCIQALPRCMYESKSFFWVQAPCAVCSCADDIVQSS
jgi:hypothetical protein